MLDINVLWSVWNIGFSIEASYGSDYYSMSWLDSTLLFLASS
jgi:hypothetical protein